MRTKGGLFAFINVVISTCTFGQTGDLNILTVDRPGIADMPFTVAPGMYQFEVGFDYFSRYNGDVYNLPVAMFRTGISSAAEIRVSTRNLMDYTESQKFAGFAPITVGVKVHIIEQNEWIPETDIMAGMSFPVSHKPSQPRNLGHNIYLLFQNDFYPNMALNYNVGMFWDGIHPTPFFSGAFCFNYQPTRRLGMFIEYYDYANSDNPWEHGMDGGFTYLLMPHFQLDLSGGGSIIEDEMNYFVSTGFSIRLQKSALRCKQQLD